MAYAALVSLSQTINKLLYDEYQYPISPNQKQRIISIHQRSILFQAFLEDYSEKACSLEARIRDAANRAENILEYFMWKQTDQRQNYTSRSIGEPKSSGVCDLSGYWFDFKNLEKVAKEIELIPVEVMDIKNSARTKDVQQLHDSSSLAATSSSRLIIGSTKCKLDFATVGIEDELMAIKARLRGESSKLQVIPIFGMGGIGKTTLAKNAFDDQLIVEHFQIRAWVTVSQDYSAPQVLSSLLVSLRGEHSKESVESKMDENVYKSLKGWRYLIVMDDMWSTKAWDDVRRIFPDDCNGSRIILTTRLLDVAAYPDSFSPPHEKRFMDAFQSWNLLRQKVFPRGNCPPELEDIGKGIARSCRGLPLATVAIAGLLSSVSQTPASWKNIARNVHEAVSRNEEKFAEIVLSLSYNHLPHHLRPCFLYMGIFPEDYEIRVSNLIKLWVAEGFLKLPNGTKSWEEVAEEYLEDLVKRSFVLVTRRKSNGKIKSCRLHDLVRDLCIRKAEQEKFLAHVKDNEALQKSMTNQRRICIAPSADLHCLKVIYGSPIHTIICTKVKKHKRHEFTWDSLQNIILLRVLDVADELPTFCRLPPFCPHVNKLFHLRYLALPHQVKIPAAISNLENLQTLIIYLGSKSYPARPTVCLPSEVWRMGRLRHLVSSCYFDGLPDTEAAHFALENLQTLSKVLNFACTEGVVPMIPNLKKLGISYSEDADVGHHQLRNLQFLSQLEKLKLEVRRRATIGKWKLHSFHEGIKAVFPTTLKKLTLSGCKLPWEDMGILVGSLPDLEVLKLKSHACIGDKWETSEGEFRQLKFLLIEGSLIQQWITESSHFPRLKCLVLRCCHRLEQIPDGIGEIPTLELIEVDYKNRHLVRSAKRIQEDQQQNWGNDGLRVLRISPFEESW